MTDNVFHIGSREGLKSEYLDRVKALGLSQRAAADRIGISPTALSQWLADKYKGDVPAVEAKVERWLHTEREAERHSLEAAGLDIHRDLAVTEEIGAALAHAQAVGDVVLIHGQSGAGKSWAVDHYCRHHSASHYVSMTSAVGSLSVMLRRVREAIERYGSERSAAEYEESVIRLLQGRGGLLVVDEAHHLSARLLDELRCIRDHAGCGLALIGNDRILMTLARCPQILGRIALRLEQKEPAEGDVATLVSGVLKRRATAREVKIAHRVAAGPGGLHALRRMLERAWIAARVDGRDDVGIDDIESASADASTKEKAA